MSRRRISTTVDSDRLARARQLLPGPDSVLIDRALGDLINSLEGEHERWALTQYPYEQDPELAWEVPPGPDLTYEGEAPAEVQRVAAARRTHR